MEIAEMNKKIDGIDEKLKQLLTDGKLKLDENKEPKEEIEVLESKKPIVGKQENTEKHKNWWRVYCRVVIGATMISALGAGFVALYAGIGSLLSGVAFARGIAATGVGMTSVACVGAILGSIAGRWLGCKDS